MQQNLKCVYQHPLLSENDLARLASKHQRTVLKKNEFLLREGEISAEYFILESGIVRGFVHDYDQNEITTEFFVENDIVIVPSSLFQKIPSQENLQAVKDCVLWKINYDDFQELFHEIEGFREWGRVWFSYQVFSMKQRSLDVVMKTASERYLKLMKEKPQIIRNVPLKQIASYLGITDSSLSRIRREI